MREGWEQKRLSEVCIIKPPKNEARVKLKETDLVTFLPMEDLGIMAKEISATRERKLKEVIGGYTYFTENDVLLAKITPCFENGKLGIARGLKNGVGFGSSEYVVFRSYGNILPEYLFYFLAREQFKVEGCKAMTGAVGHKRVSKDFIENYIIPFPNSLSEQKRIVAILDEAFAAIDQAKANVEKNLQNARELFESYLQGVFGNPGKDWEEKVLDEVCEFQNGQAHEMQIDENGKFILVNSKFISSNGEVYKRTGSALSPLFKGEIVLVMSDVPNGKALAKCFLIDKDDTYSLNQRICVIRSKKFNNKFLYYQLNRHKYLLSFNNGENQTNLRKNDILNCPLLVPSMKEQDSLVSKIDDMLLETQKLETIYRQKLTDLEELKKSILQKAFAGELG
ncbi:MAG: restriction endonuclease subunit S [Lewinellaceae bacterium]|nr:restriction endonuclease subunit S [Lewinellaceae bacterium]